MTNNEAYRLGFEKACADCGVNAASLCGLVKRAGLGSGIVSTIAALMKVPGIGLRATGRLMANHPHLGAVAATGAITPLIYLTHKMDMANMDRNKLDVLTPSQQKFFERARGYDGFDAREFADYGSY